MTSTQVEDLPKQAEMTVNSSSLPKSSCLGVLGVPGLSAYLALVQVVNHEGK
jgi:NADPH-dependent curcumin reductase CurA